MSWWSSKPVKKHALTITASSTYDDPQATVVPVNSEDPITIDSSLAEIQLLVRIRGFKGTAEHTSNPTTSAYFDTNKDTNISIQLCLTPHVDLPGDELLFGNDFAYPIRDFLPYGTGTGLKLFKTYVDPSVDGDLFIDEPFLYGRALSSFNVINNKSGKLVGGEVIKEDLVNDGDTELAIPAVNTERQKYFQSQEHLRGYTFFKDHTYQFDFFSGLMSLKDGEFHISLPGGFELSLSKYLNEKFSSVRYVLKRSGADEMGVKSGEPLLVLTFQLGDAEEVPEEPASTEHPEEEENENLDEEID